MEKMEIYNKFKAVPEVAKKPIQAGRLKGMTDINPMWRIKMLTEEFGMCGIGWYLETVVREIKDGSDGQKVAFIGLNLFVKVKDEWSKPIYGEGGSSFVTNERNGPYTSDEAFKMAYTDAISICCKMLGMGADVYFAKDRSKYSPTASNQEQQKKVIDPKTIERIKSEVANCKTLEDLKQVWTNNKSMQKEKFFIESKENRKKILIDNGITE